ncbi:histidine kinase [Leptospira santarosai]|uniref:GHKL domain protein n=6 Tax=Leptospira santarosai TaxID=28183 RepID=A0A1V2EK90_9LEPT|nr:histidine kinase [Leptospira santarosai]EMO56148.1 GHKL domain protein [Leptospira santarosai str. CBC1416]ASV12284.1 histidine kinase [Leptospira santarosai]AVQ12960.1 GHKL domain protein [Leptospira santarosai]AVV50730.1 GHKL domain protein [Leptospira santarosai]AVV79035.1 GHKL domain protein [Leptospira santarosai]
MMEQEDISDNIRLTIENGKILSLKTHRMTRSVEEHIQKAVGLILDRVTHPTLIPTVYTIIKELVINACKANQKRIFFEEKGLDLNDISDYEKGVREYKNIFSEEMAESYGQKAKKEGYYCLISFYYSADGIRIEVVNNAPITVQEEKSLREKLEKGMRYNDIAQFYLDNEDNTEGAGLGLALILIMLKGEGIDPSYFRIIIREDVTIARLEIPLTPNFQSIRNTRS